MPLLRNSVSSNMDVEGYTEKPIATHGESIPEVDDDLRDHPKNWHVAIKLAVLANLCFMVFNGNFYAAGISSALSALVREFGVGYNQVGGIVSYAILLFGLGAFIWIPTAVVLGKRPVLLLSQMCFVIGCIWGTKATSFYSLLGSRIFGSLGAGAVQAVGPAVVGELFFERNYSKAMSAYTLSLCIGSQLGPLIAGHIVEDRGWRWYFILLSVLSGVNLLTIIFFCPETAFHREVEVGATGADVDADILRHTAASTRKQSSFRTLRQNTFYLRHPHVRGRGMRQWCLSFLLQLEYLFDPIVLCSAGMWGIALAWIATISVITNQIFTVPPFGWNSAQIGNWAATSLIGVILAFPIAGPLTDVISNYIGTRRGKHLPEYRLVPLIIPFLVCSSGLMLFPYTYLKGSYVGPAVGYAMEITSLMFIPTAVLSYAVDSYPYDASEVTAFINAVTHIIPFGLTETSADWLQKVGIEKLFVTMAIVQWCLIAGLSGLLIWFGPFLRPKALLVHTNYGVKRLFS